MIEKSANISIAVIGKSAAGKFAFIKSFSKYPEYISSEGQGQTTRSYSEYCFITSEDDIVPKANILFYDEN